MWLVLLTVGASSRDMRGSGDGAASNATKVFAATLMVVAWAICSPEMSASAVPGTVTAQLDGDSPLEQVERVETEASEAEASSGCSYLRIVDGARTQRLTPSKGSYSPYCLVVQKVSVRDLTGDGRAEVTWATNISGGRAIRIGTHAWNGRSARRIFSENPGNIGGGRFSFLPEAFITAPRRGLREIKIRDGIHEPGDALCCPSFRRTRRFRWNGRRMGLVPGSTKYVRLHA